MKVSHTYADKTAEEVKALFKDNADYLLGQYGDFIGDHRWISETRLEGAGRGVKATAYVQGQTIVVEGKLPFALKLFAKKIESVVAGKLERMGGR
jgi:hypothetical protein